MTTSHARILPEHVEHWLEHGYAIVEGFLTAEELDAARSNLFELTPTWEQFTAGRPAQDGWLAETWNALEFPYEGDALNQVATHPDIHTFCADVLGTDQIFLAASVISAKYAGGTDFDQQLHTDYGNNTLTFPREDGRYRQVLLIVYYSDVTPELGPTYVVSQRHTRDTPELMRRQVLPRDEFAPIYDQELPAVLRAGSAVLYAMHTFHRGSAIRAQEGARFSHHLSYRASDIAWVGHHTAWPRHGMLPAMSRFLTQATPQQREMIGFPAVGDPFWTEGTIERVEERYPGIDLRPYREAISSGASERTLR